MQNCVRKFSKILGVIARLLLNFYTENRNFQYWSPYVIIPVNTMSHDVIVIMVLSTEDTILIKALRARKLVAKFRFSWQINCLFPNKIWTLPGLNYKIDAIKLCSMDRRQLGRTAGQNRQTKSEHKKKLNQFRNWFSGCEINRGNHGHQVILHGHCQIIQYCFLQKKAA